MFKSFDSLGSILIVFLTIMIIVGVICGFAFPYAVNTWLVYAGKEPAVVWWQGFAVGLIPGIGEIVVVGAVVTWIIMLFL